MALVRLFIFHFGFFHLLDTRIANYEFILVRHIIKKDRTFIKVIIISSSLGLIVMITSLVVRMTNVVGVNTHIL